MSSQSLIAGLLLMLTVTLLTACSGDQNDNTKAVFKQIPELQEIQPQRPVKIKLKRNSKGAYSWDLSGSDVEGVLRTDRRLKEYLEMDNDDNE